MKELIKNMFRDNRELKEIKEIYNGFETEDNEIIVINLHMGDFTSESLADYTEEAEELYDKYQKTINLYIAMDKCGEIKVTEHSIKSHADFKIKLGQINLDPCRVLLDKIKFKIENNSYTQEDIEMLQLTPLFANKENKKEVRAEVFELLEMIL